MFVFCKFVPKAKKMKPVRSKYRLFFVILLFTVLGCFSYFFLAVYSHPATDRSAPVSVKAFAAIIFISNVIGLSLLQINHRMQNAFPDLLKDNRRRLLYLPVVALLLLIINYLMLVSVRRIMALPEPFALQDRGLRIMLLVWLVELVVVGQIVVNNFYHHLISLRKHTEELEESTAKAKYQALQSQLNPHFLFNNLNALISEIECDPANAIRFTRHLSDVYRYILQCHDRRSATLREELEFLDSYIFLHRVRLGDCIHVQNGIAPELIDKKVPPLTLQLLAENVIKHNVISTGKPMTIDLSIDSEGRLCMSNEVRVKKDAVPSGKGLKNLSGRYRLLCGKDIAVERENNRFTVKMPLLYE